MTSALAGAVHRRCIFAARDFAGLVGCYRGLTTKGGPKGVGVAVNETLVLCVIALFAVNVVLTTIGVRFGTGR